MEKQPEGQQQGLSKCVIERIFQAVADAYEATVPECRGVLWQNLIAFCDIISTGQISGKLVARVDLGSRVTATERGTRIEPLRVDNAILDLPSMYLDLIKQQEEELGGTNG